MTEPTTDNVLRETINSPSEEKAQVSLPSHSELMAALKEDNSLPGQAPRAEGKEDIQLQTADKPKFAEEDDPKREEEEVAAQTPEAKKDDPRKNQFEKKARDQGWKPKDEFNGPLSEWVDAKEYIDRGPLFEKINNQNKELKKTKKTLDEVLSILRQQGANQVKDQAEKTLIQKEAAIAEGDIEAAIEYESKYQKYKGEIDQFEQTQKNPYVAPETYEFVERNKNWYNNHSPENKAMMEYAISVDNKLASEHPHMDMGERLHTVEKQVKSFFSTRFENPNRARQAPVEKKTPSRPKDTKMIYQDLPSDVKKIVDSFVRQDRRNISLNEKRTDYAQSLLVSGAVKYE